MTRSTPFVADGGEIQGPDVAAMDEGVGHPALEGISLFVEGRQQGPPITPTNRGRDMHLLREALGEEFVNSYVKLKKREWDSYHSHLSQWELDHTLDT